MIYELLAPAGDMQAMIQAVQNGADAVYLGGKSFGARAFADNFSNEELTDAIAYAHTYGVKVYITVNTLVYESETEGFLQHIEAVLQAGADALIMQDIGMIAAVHCRFPDAVLHASTQMHNHSDAALEFARSLGLKRAVLAREMNIDQIRSLQCAIDKEVFVHGALCICYSGQCLFSALTNGRSGNRGTCAQSCRMRYKLLDAAGKHYDTNGDYLLSPKDIGVFEDISMLMEAGVNSFKIEGRMKTPEYVGLVTKIYAKLLRDCAAGRPPMPDKKETAELFSLFNRGYSKAHLIGVSGEALLSKDRPNHRGTPLGSVLSVKNDRIRLRLSAALNQGDGIKFERSDDGFICNKIYKDGLLTASAQTGDTVELDAKAKTAAGDTVVKTSDVLLLKSLQTMETRRVPVTGILTAKEGEAARLVLSDADGHTAVALGLPVERSRTAPANRDELYAGVSKLGDTPYELKSLTVDADENIFIAKSALNALRRDAAEKLTALRTAITSVRISNEPLPSVQGNVDESSLKLHVLVRNTAQFKAVKDIVSGDIYTDDTTLYFENKAAYPRLRLRTDRLAPSPEPFHGERLLVTDHGGLHAYPSGNDITIDHTVYALNASALAVLVSYGAQRIALSPELDMAQTAQLMAVYKRLNSQPAPAEAVLYARHELMAMRHCVLLGALGKSACGLCKEKRFSLEDLKGNRHPFFMDNSCQTHVFHSRATQKSAAEYLALGISHFRIELFDEDAAQSRQLVKQYISQLAEQKTQ